MNNVIFLFETFNPNKRTTFFKHRNYTKYLAYSEYAIKNKTTDHGLFGKIIEFPDIEKMQNIEPINEYIINLASNRIPIFRCTISLDEYDACPLESSACCKAIRARARPTLPCTLQLPAPMESCCPTWSAWNLST